MDSIANLSDFQAVTTSTDPTRQTVPDYVNYPYEYLVTARYMNYMDFWQGNQLPSALADPQAGGWTFQGYDPNMLYARLAGASGAYHGQSGPAQANMIQRVLAAWRAKGVG